MLRYKLVVMNRIVIVVLIGVWLSSCKKDPEFSRTPAISFSSIKRYEFLDQGTLTKDEYVDITMLFQDGDGDLGAVSTGNGDNNLRYQTYRRTQGQDSLIRDWQELRFSDLAPEENYIGPLSGDFTTTIAYPSSDVNSSDTSYLKYNDTIVYKLSIFDRAKNESNIEQTSPIILFPR